MQHLHFFFLSNHRLVTKFDQKDILTVVIPERKKLKSCFSAWFSRKNAQTIKYCKNSKNELWNKKVSNKTFIIVGGSENHEEEKKVSEKGQSFFFLCMK